MSSINKINPQPEPPGNKATTAKNISVKVTPAKAAIKKTGK